MRTSVRLRGRTRLASRLAAAVLAAGLLLPLGTAAPVAAGPDHPAAAHQAQARAVPAVPAGSPTRASARSSAALPAATCTAAGTTRTCDLYAETGTMPASALPGAPAAGIPVWGYDTASGAVAAPGGPTLIANEGETLVVILHNVNIPSATSLMVAGLPVAPDTTGVTMGNATTYTFTAGAPGTYLYEAGLTADGPRQAAMGLYGALIVRPAAAGQAYADASTAFDDEAALVLSEIDPAFNQATAANAAFDFSHYAPTYWLINGKAYPNTDPIATDVGRKVLLRYVNAGLGNHSMSLLGLHQTIIATDAQPTAVANQATVVAETIPAGGTLDTIATMPATAPANAKFALYDAAMLLDNNGVSTGGVIDFGGMLTFLTSSGTSTPAGPVTSAVSLSPNPTSGPGGTAPGPVTLTASISGSPDQAEYFVDTHGADGTGCAITAGSSVSVTIPVTGATAPCADLTTLSSGNHTFYVHGHDANGWGAVSSAVLNLDKAGPSIGNMGLTPSQTNGSVDVVLQATGSDVATGNQNVAAAEYTIDGGAATAITVALPATSVSLSATIPAATVAALSEGAHTVAVRAEDALGNWGAFGSVTLNVDKTGPGTSGVSATPNPNNGTLGVQVTSGGGFYERIDATATDPLAGGVSSNIVAAEYYIDTDPGLGKGGAMFASDGVYSGSTEKVYAAIDLYAINQLATGTHTVAVRGKDAAGNWGPISTTPLVIDKIAPTFTSITLAPNPTNGAATVTLTVNGAADTGGAGVAGGEYWINPPTTTAPAPGGGTQFSGTTATIPVGSLATGSYTVSARIRDAAGNWSSTASATLQVVPDAIFSNGFETGTTPWGWTSASTTSGTRLSVTTTAPLVGTRSLQAQGSNTNYVQYTFGTAAQPATATYDARFYFNPNNNASTGQDILAAATSGTFGTQLFHVRYRRSGTQPQVQVQVGTTANATWTNVTNNAGNYLEIVWRSGISLQLYVNGVLSQTITTATTGSVAAVRLGSVTSGGSSTLELFDAFASKRTVSPLLGP